MKLQNNLITFKSKIKIYGRVINTAKKGTIIILKFYFDTCCTFFLYVYKKNYLIGKVKTFRLALAKANLLKRFLHNKEPTILSTLFLRVLHRLH